MIPVTRGFFEAARFLFRLKTREMEPSPFDLSVLVLFLGGGNLAPF